MSTAKTALREKREAHHLWNAEREDGKIRIQRTKAEKDDWEEEVEKKTASRREASMDKSAGKQTAQAMWSVFGASLVDDSALTSEIPKSVAQRLNACVDEAQNAPSIPTWDEIRTAYGAENVDEARQNIANGMHDRIASKFYDLPLAVTAEIRATLPDVGKEHVKAMLDAVRSGKVADVVRVYGDDARKVARIYNKARVTGMYKLAVDQDAKKILEDYWGPFGKELTRSIQKRVRADLAERWMRRHAVDEPAAKVFSAYFGEYGEQWVNYVAPLLRPKK